MGGPFLCPPMLREGGCHRPPHLSVEGGACFFFRKMKNEGGGHTPRLSVPTRLLCGDEKYEWKRAKSRGSHSTVAVHQIVALVTLVRFQV